jgi:tRNA pseudouridine13 synthase
VKLKRLPEDFQVEELTQVGTSDGGDFALYRLAKRGLGTPEAVEAVVRRWQLARGQISYGGLKDRHAVTQQYLTIRRGPRRNLKQTNLELDYLGQTTRPFTPADITGNRFHVVLRSLSDRDARAAQQALEQVRQDGLPNYFDDQRFGSVGSSGEFVARAWIAGDYERALWLALADPNPLDRPREREQKRLLREHWGDWPTCAAKLDRSPHGSAVLVLADRPGDYRTALARVPAELRSIYLAAFQSYLWNRLLAELILVTCRPEQLVPVPLKLGPAPFFAALDEQQRAALETASLPLPSSRVRLDPGPIKQLVDRTLSEMGLELRAIRVKYPRDSFFSKGWRPATFSVAGLSYETAPDELYRGRRKLMLCFDSPRGTYATILVKRITAAAGSTPVDWEPDDNASEEIEAAR